MSQARETINRTVKTVITCDVCKCSYEARGCCSITELKALLKVNGWSFGKYLKCPECRQKRKVTD